MNKKISDKDKKDWEKFLSDKDPLPNKDSNLSKRKISKVKSIDLHGYSLNEANERIMDFILQSYNDRINKIIVITGKGIHSENEKDPYVSKDLGILKYSVPNFIKSNHELMKRILEFREANTEDGGGGAFYIFLKKKK
ncbi:Smr/MutS family protein [Candidatus Pelagibacter sp.]|nr:Smr/MutS family protein [Candidatus Pelagibacter sp.]